MRATYDDWLTAQAAKPRFGQRDRLGTANYIDELARIRAAESIVSGEPVSLARPMRPSPSPRGDDKPGFSVEVFYTDGPIGMGSDHVELDCHGRANTHLDALNHISIGGHWYAGWAVDDVEGPSVEAPADLLLEAASGRINPVPAVARRRLKVHDIGGLLQLAPIVQAVPGIPGGPILQLAARTVGGAGGIVGRLFRRG